MVKEVENREKGREKEVRKRKNSVRNEARRLIEEKENKIMARRK